MLTMTHTRLSAIILALLCVGPVWADKPHTTQELLLPHFQVAFPNQGETTLLTLGNSAAEPLTVRADICTNWGISVLQFSLELAPRQIRHFNLNDLLHRGIVPDNPRLTGADLTRLREALCGHKLTGAGHYLGTETQPGCAVGFIHFKVASQEAPYLWGRYTLMDRDQVMVANNPMLNVDMSDPTNEICKRHGMRVFFEGMRNVDAHLMIWTDTRVFTQDSAKPSTTQGYLTAWDEDGNFMQAWTLDLLASNRFDIFDFLESDEPCWFELTTEVDAHMAVQMEETCDELEIHAWCMTNEGIRIEKTTNGVDADTAPGPEIKVGHNVVWRYSVTNLGNDMLYDVLVTDDRGVAVDCPQTELAPSETMVCIARGKAEPCQYANVGTVTAHDGYNNFVSDDDPSHYYGVEKTRIEVNKFMNDPAKPEEDRNCEDLPEGLQPGKVLWVYEVTNQGDSPLYDVVLVDTEAGVEQTWDILEPGQTVRYSQAGHTEEGRHRNVAEVSGVSQCGIRVVDLDVCEYCFNCPNIMLNKYTNSIDTAGGPGPTLVKGDAVIWTYEVINTGTVTLYQVTVEDETEGHIFPAVTLEPQQYHTFTLEGVVQDTCPNPNYTNQATATGTTRSGITVTDHDISHYRIDCGPSPLPWIGLVKKTNGEPRTAPGPELIVGSTVTWTFEVTNGNQIPLTNVVLEDKVAGHVVKTFRKDRLDIDETWIVSYTGIVACDSYQNDAEVSGVYDTFGNRIFANDSSWYTGIDAGGSLELIKKTNGIDADQAPGPELAVGDPVTWTYTVTNTGTAALTDVTVVDITEGKEFKLNTTLVPGASHTFTYNSTVICGLYTNRARATGRTECAETLVEAEAVNYYTGLAETAVNFMKLTNDIDTNRAGEPRIPVGQQVTWTYIVANEGRTTLYNAVVRDQTEDVTFGPFTLEPGDSKTFTYQGVAVCGQYCNTATLTATDDCGNQLTSTVNSCYYGTGCAGSIDLEKATNGHDADQAPGPEITVDDPVTWTYVVTNTGNVALTDVRVTDETENAEFGPVDLAVGASHTFQRQGVAGCGLYSNAALATGLDTYNNTVQDVDMSHYTGIAHPSIELEKYTNGMDADQGPGPILQIGDAVTWTYVVTNTGPVPLTEITVKDTTENIDFGPIDLAVGASHTFTHTGMVTDCGLYKNQAVARAKGPCGVCVGDIDQSHYTATEGEAAIDVETYIDNDDADNPPGVELQKDAVFTLKCVVRNTGMVRLDNVMVYDRTEGTQQGPFSLNPGEKKVFRHKYPVLHTTYKNLTDTIGVTACGAQVTDADPSHYFVEPCNNGAIDLEKATNGYDADQAPGPILQKGDTVIWTYVVTNIGASPLTNVMVVDETENKTFGPIDLAPGASHTFSLTAEEICSDCDNRQYANRAVVTAVDECDNQVTDEDWSHYLCEEKCLEGAIDLEKATNGHDADQAPGPHINAGESVTWTYVVTNIGASPLTNVTVFDEQENVSFGPVALAPGQSHTFSLTDDDACGRCHGERYANKAVATAEDDCGNEVQDVDWSHYHCEEIPPCENGSLDLEKYTNGQDADQAPGPHINPGDAVTWTYVVTNTGASTLYNVIVVDEEENKTFGPIQLAPGEKATFSLTDDDACGRCQGEGYANKAVATAEDDCGNEVSDEDWSHYHCDDNPPPDAEGCSPGYWKNHSYAWYPTVYRKWHQLADVFEAADDFDALAGDSLMDALSYSGGTGEVGAARALLRQAVAAVLNASHRWVDFPLSKAEIIILVNTALEGSAGDMEFLKDTLDAYNNISCPLN